MCLPISSAFSGLPPVLSKARSGARVSAREVDTDRLQARTQFEQRAQLVVKSGLDLAELDRIDPAVAERLADHAGPPAAGLDGEDEQVEQAGSAQRDAISERYPDVAAGRGQPMPEPVTARRPHHQQALGG